MLRSFEDSRYAGQPSTSQWSSTGRRSAEREIVTSHLGDEIPPHALGTAGFIAKDVSEDGVVEEGAAQLGRHRLHVGLRRPADVHVIDAGRRTVRTPYPLVGEGGRRPL
jgi:hypothetical protein